MTDIRPDPDQLLAQWHRDRERARRGQLRIYFGASAGVGKTFAMLSAAQKERELGRDVLVGVIETHGRAETQRVLEGLPLLPPRPVNVQGRELGEFDLDAALARQPSLLLVDELAHSNAEGSRHQKRWQDVQELLSAGIDVWTTLNVQHLESLNDVVGGITGIRVMETLADQFFDQADEVVLVDLPPEQLLQRLREGKVYPPEQAERALRHFFRKGNLLALRELALRRTADRVEDEVRSYRVERAIPQVWATQGGLLACITHPDTAAAVVRHAARLAQQQGCPWQAVAVETPGWHSRPESWRADILAHLRLAESLQAQAQLVSGEDAAAALLRHARQHNLQSLVVAAEPLPGGWRWRPWARADVATRLTRAAADLSVLWVPVTAPVRPLPATAFLEEGGDPGRHPRRWLVAPLSVAATTVVAALLFPWFATANIVMLYLLNVVLVARWAGRQPSFWASVLGVACFDYFFVEPRFSFAVSDVQYLLTFSILLFVGLLVGQLTAHLHVQLRMAGRREQQVRSLLALSNALSSALQTEQVLADSPQGLQAALGAEVVLIVPDDAESLQFPECWSQAADRSVAQWAYDHQQAAGWGTATLPSCGWRFVPLMAPVRIRGLLALKGQPGALPTPEEARHMEACARLVGTALERVHFIEVAQSMGLRMESERLRHSLLQALSHDLRTPLTALRGWTDTLAMSQPPLTDAQQQLVGQVQASAERMNRLVHNLLDMARLQSGEVRLRLDWQSAAELWGSALNELGEALAGRPLEVDAPHSLPLFEADALLLQRVLVNWLENALKYTPEGSPLLARARMVEEDGRPWMQLSLRDHGPGLPAHLGERVFDKFTRGQPESSVPGVGLGLAIAKAIVEAHGGRIRAHNEAGGGACLSLCLPWHPPPDCPPESLLENPLESPPPVQTAGPPDARPPQAP